MPALSFCLRDSDALRPCTFGTRLSEILQSSSAIGSARSEGFNGMEILYYFISDFSISLFDKIIAIYRPHSVLYNYCV